MAFLAFKYALTAALVVIVSEVAKHSGRLGALIAALPLISLLVLFWMHAEKQPQEKIGQYAHYTFWYVLPTLPMFLAFPRLLPRVGFWPTIAMCLGLTLICFGLTFVLLKPFGIHLIPPHT